MLLTLSLLLALPASASLPDIDFNALRARPGGSMGAVPAIPDGSALSSAAGSTRWEALAQELAQSHPEIPAAAVQKLFRYLQAHPVSNMEYVTIIDMDKPSSERRMYIIKLADGSVESFLVAHGSGSGSGAYAEKFSDANRSHMTSLGIYVTGAEEEGKHGRDLKLNGMEASNDATASRAVEIHGAAYVSDEYLREHGRIGDSWGCPAVDFRYRDHIIDEIGRGSVLLIYHS